MCDRFRREGKKVEMGCQVVSIRRGHLFNLNFWVSFLNDVTFRKFLERFKHLLSADGFKIVLEVNTLSNPLFRILLFGLFFTI